MSIDTILETAPAEPQSIEATPNVVTEPQTDSTPTDATQPKEKQDKPRQKSPEKKSRTIEEISNTPNKELTRDEARLVREQVEGKRLTSDDISKKMDDLDKGDTKSRNESKPKPSEKDESEDAPEENGDDRLNKLFKRIAPHANGDIEQIEEAYKNLQYDHSQKGEVVNKLKEYGLDNSEKVSQALERMVNMDKAIEQSLQSPEGITKLQEMYGIKPSQSQSFNESSAENNTNKDALGIDQFLNSVGDDDFIEGKRFKELLPSLANHISQQFEQKYGSKVQELEQTNSKFQTFMSGIMKRNQERQELANSFNDVSTISQEYSQYDPTYTLTDNPEKIWAESIEKKGGKQVIKQNPHPEFHKFKKIYGMSVEAKKAGYPNVRAYIAEQLLSTGKLGEIQTQTRQDVHKQFLDAKAKSLQPSVSQTKGSPKSGLKLPRNSADVKKMSKTDRRRLLQAVRRGEVKTT